MEFSPRRSLGGLVQDPVIWGLYHYYVDTFSVCDYHAMIVNELNVYV